MPAPMGLGTRDLLDLLDLGRDLGRGDVDSMFGGFPVRALYRTSQDSRVGEIQFLRAAWERRSGVDVLCPKRLCYRHAWRTKGGGSAGRLGAISEHGKAK